MAEEKGGAPAEKVQTNSAVSSSAESSVGTTSTGDAMPRNTSTARCRSAGLSWSSGSSMLNGSRSFATLVSHCRNGCSEWAGVCRDVSVLHDAATAGVRDAV